MAVQGSFAALIDRKYPLEQIRNAHRYVDTGQKIGNVLVIVCDA
jgi:NADPH:quinone reductase-like Zn-dependent oxidoreductase